MKILGISCNYHDAAACLLVDGTIVAAVQEERFSRIKHDDRLPVAAMGYCLAESGIDAGALDVVAFYEKPLSRFGRFMETMLTVVPRGLPQFLEAIPAWSTKKLWLEAHIDRALYDLGAKRSIAKSYIPHHLSHAASAYYPSPFPDAAVLTADGVGEHATTTIGRGEGERLELLSQITFPHSLGLLYSAFTYYCGFRVNSGEYKLMGLAPYGSPVYAELIRRELIDLKPDGSFMLNMQYFTYEHGLKMLGKNFETLLGGPARKPESEITKREMDIAASIQQVTEEAMLNLARQAMRITGSRNLCLAGGLALNCVANGRIWRDLKPEGMWIQPAAGDAGGALGAALETAARGTEEKPGWRAKAQHSMQGSLLGPSYAEDEIKQWLDHLGVAYRKVEKTDLPKAVAQLVADQKVVGLLQGRMEYGPRALGNRSIIGDPRSTKMQSLINRKVKFRESFRPFAPAILETRVNDYAEFSGSSPYMLMVAKMRNSTQGQSEHAENELMERLWSVSSPLPAVTHVDCSARLQTVSEQSNAGFFAILQAFEELTGCPALINTSFNVRGEPIVCTPDDALACFMRSEIDALVLETFIVGKDAIPERLKQAKDIYERVLD